MGDPKKLRSKYSRPLQVWNKERIEEDTKLVREYALKNRTELWKMRSLLRKLQGHAKRLVRLDTEQAKKETEQLLSRLERMGLLEKKAELNAILSLEVKALLERRLQTILYQKKK